jgi:tetratricopeptide (TPR) repeat protein
VCDRCNNTLVFQANLPTKSRERISHGNDDKAIADFTKAIELSKATLKRNDVAISYFNRGTSYNHKEEYEKAIADFNKAI